jgi:hypothetical protein
MTILNGRLRYRRVIFNRLAHGKKRVLEVVFVEQPEDSPDSRS